MNLRSINAALKTLEDEGGDKMADKLILCVPVKRGKVFDREDVVKAIAKDRGEPLAEVKRMLKDYKPAVYVRANSLHYGLTEGDACLLRAEGRHADSMHGMEIVYFHPSTDLNLKDAVVVDENMEHHTDLHKAVADIAYGSRPSRRSY